ncbi:MAG: [protein-PII] uridylyltransferase [Pseudomonadales bacterium]|nr:[protein-PII] uridylyltransferase [Pseudomonadales bacterium]
MAESATPSTSPEWARGEIDANTRALADRYWQRADVAELVVSRTRLFDDLLGVFFHHHFGQAVTGVALIAVGGFGRAELFPGSDIDICLLVDTAGARQATIEAFLHDLYDLRVEVGFSVRTPEECESLARDDITIATALFERRLLAGDTALATRLDSLLTTDRLWPGAEFFRAKHDEQIKRHARFDNVDYGLEPNVKSSPGGLRDYHTAIWVCMRQFGTSSPEALVDLGVLTEQEKDWLVEGRRFLWWVRFGLHLLTGRKEDRLQFEYQRELARRLGFADTHAKLGVERFMQMYYHHVLELREVNDILLQDFAERILPAPDGDRLEEVNARFRLRNRYIETVHDRVFRDTPSALMELFVVMAHRRDISGVRASTIRLIRESLDLIDDNFRNDPRVTGLFISLLRAPYTLVSQLTRMRRYGILGRYIPEFGRIIGQMQHDLFHIYTVDAHTMMVIRNMRRFFYRTSARTFPVAWHCVHQLPKIELLYLAGLFHDIAKGRGGDHSELGATDVQAFCARHALSTADTQLVSWLVEQHLTMSSVAQRQDIYDPDVVYEFAREVKSERRLDYLYALTVADINATNPTLWNSYRATLMRHLYAATRRALRRGLESPMDKAATIEAKRESALRRIRDLYPEHDQADVESLWAAPNEEFFLRHSARHIARVSHLCLKHDPRSAPLVFLHNTTAQVAGEAVTEVYVYTTDQPGLFGRATAAIDRLNLSIFEASINTTDDGICFNVFVVLNDDNTVIPPREHVRMARSITAALQTPPDPTRARRVPRQLKQLSRRTECAIRTEPGSNFSSLTIKALDRPGLLADIGSLFSNFGVTVLRARIATLGERAEDIFDIQTANGSAYDAAGGYELSHALRQALDWHLQKAL